VGDPGDELAAARLHLPLAQAHLVGPHRGGGEAAAEPYPDAEADGAREGEHDQQYLQVVLGDEHAARHAEDAGEDGEQRDGEQHADVDDDRALPDRAQDEPPGHGDDEGTARAPRTG
jgi:hypothetical protein